MPGAGLAYPGGSDREIEIFQRLFQAAILVTQQALQGRALGAGQLKAAHVVGAEQGKQPG